MRHRFHHLANLLSGNATMVVRIACGLIVTRIVIQQLGIGAFGIVAFVLSLGFIIARLGAALSSATGRFVTKSVAVGNDEEASDYLTNTLSAMALVGVVGITSLALYSWISPSVSEKVSVGFVVTMTLSMILASTSSVVGVGIFIREKFVLRAGIQILSRLTNAAIAISLMCFAGVGIWSLAMGHLGGSVILIVCFWISLKKLLPAIKLHARFLSGKRMFEIATFTGWSLLAFCGSYIVRTGTMVVVQNNMSEDNLGRYALAIQVGMLLLGCLQAIIYVADPKIYRNVAQKDYRNATRTVERFLHLMLCVGLTALVALMFEGENLLHLWLGKSTPDGMFPLLMGCTFSAVATSIGSPFGTYLAGIGQIRNLAFIIVAEGIIVVTTAAFLLHDGTDRLVWITFLPGCLAMVRSCLLIPLLYHRVLSFSPIVSYFKKGVVLLILVGCTALARWAVGQKIDGTGIFSVSLRMVTLLIPLGLYVLFRVFAGKKRIKAAA